MSYLTIALPDATKNQLLQVVTIVSLTYEWAWPATAAAPAPSALPTDNPVARLKLAWTDEIDRANVINVTTRNKGEGQDDQRCGKDLVHG